MPSRGRLALTICVEAALRSRRVCGGSSSSERPEHLVGEAVGDGDVVARHLDVLDRAGRCASTVLIGRWYWCSSAIARISVRYFMWSRRVRVRVSRKVSSRAKGLATSSGLQQPLRVAVELAGPRRGLVRGEQAFERLALALQPVDRPGLLAVLVHRQHHAAVQQLLVDLDRRRRRGRSSPALRRGTRASRACPSCGSLPVDAIVSSPSLCRSFSA